MLAFGSARFWKCSLLEVLAFGSARFPDVSWSCPGSARFSGSARFLDVSWSCLGGVRFSWKCLLSGRVLVVSGKCLLFLAEVLAFLARPGRDPKVLAFLLEVLAVLQLPVQVLVHRYHVSGRWYWLYTRPAVMSGSLFSKETFSFGVDLRVVAW